MVPKCLVRSGIIGGLAAGLLLAGFTPAAQLKKSDSVVKVTASAGKVDADGKQVVTVTLVINEGWHLYANPVGNETFAEAQVEVAVNAKTKPKEVKIDYPAGKVKEDKDFGDYKIYVDKAVIKATVVRADGDDSPLEVTVKLNACNKNSCLQEAKVKVPVN